MKTLLPSPLQTFVLILSMFLAACDNHGARNQGSPSAHKGEIEEHCGDGQHPDGLFLEAGWARAANPGRPVSAAYLTICNHSDKPDTLTRVETLAAKASELHQTTRDEAGRVSMAPVAQLKIDANSKTPLSQGGHHVMLIGLEAPLTKGETIDLDLYFQNAGKLTITLPIRDSEDRQSGHHH